MNAPVITVDGPSGSGKGTLCALLAKQLGWNLLDSGALYRLLAFAAGNHGIDLTNEESLKQLAAHLDVQFIDKRIILEGEEVTDAIRNEQIGAVLPWSLRCRLYGKRCCSVSVPFAKCPAWWPMVATWAPWYSPTRR